MNKHLNQEKMINRFYPAFASCENRNLRKPRMWGIVSHGIVMGIVGCFLMLCEVRADEERSVNQEIHEAVLVTEDNFEKIQHRLKNDDPLITALEMGFVVKKKKLEKLKEAIEKNKELGYIAWHKIQDLSEDLEEIESKLKSNNQNYQYHPNDYIHALLSAHAYINSKVNDAVSFDGLPLDDNTKQNLEDWRVESVHNHVQENGYYGVIYKNDKTHQIVLANRGTEGGAMGVVTDLFKRHSDWNTNLREILVGQIVVAQQARNFEATEEAVKIAKKTGYRLSFAGHSLGAWLAELSAFYSHAYFNFRNVKAVTFDSPGTFPMMKKLQSNIESRQTQVDLNDIDVVAYLARPNPVNCCNKHIGIIYSIEVKLALTDWANDHLPNWLKNRAGDKIQGLLAAEGHALEGIIATFDPETGKPKEFKRMKDWPSFEYKGDAKEFGDQRETVLSETVSVGLNGVGGVPLFISKPIGKLSAKAFDYIIGDATLMTLIDFLFNLSQIDQEQYWAYFENIDSIEEGEKCSFDKRFTLIAKAKIRKGDNGYILNPTKGSIDEYLYNLYRSELAQRKDLSGIVKAQLKELLKKFRIKLSIKGGKHELLANENYDIESVRQEARRLFSVLPEKVIQSLGHNGNIIYAISDKLSIPDNLPWHAMAHYVEIHDKEQELENRIRKESIVILSGAGGMGKSTLAAAYAKDCKEHGWRVRWIKGTQIEEEFLQLAKDLNIDIRNLCPEEVRNLVYRSFAKRFQEEKVLLIFDNIEDKDKEKIRQYMMNLPNNVKVIITARNGNLIEGIKPIKLQGFSQAEAVLYIRRALDNSEKEARNLVKTVGVSPFRLSKAVAYLKSRSLMSVDKYIREYEVIKKGAKQNEEIYPEIKLLFRDINKNEGSWQLLKSLAYLDAEGIILQLIEEITDQTDNELQDSVNELDRLSLINVIIEEGHPMVLKLSHRIVQDEAKKAIIEEEKTQTPKILEQLVSKLNKMLPFLERNPQNWDRIGRLIRHAEKILEEKDASIAGKETLLDRVGSYYYHVMFDYKKAISYWEEELSLIHKGNSSEVARLLDNIGIAYEALEGEENIRKALTYKKKALEMRQDLFRGNHESVANSLYSVGNANEALGGEAHMRKALEYYEDALKMRQDLFPGNHESVANSFDSIGNVYYTLGGEAHIRKALEYYEDALKMRQELFCGNHKSIANSFNRIGNAFYTLGGEAHIRKALKYYEDALKMHQDLFRGDPESVAIVLHNIGNAYGALKGEAHIRKAQEYHEKALEIRQDFYPGNHPSIAFSLNSVGNAYEELGGEAQISKGLTYKEEALKMRRALFPGNHSSVANSLSSIGNAYKALGGEKNIRKALEYYEEALKMQQALFPGNHPSVASAFNSIGSSYYALKGKEDIRKELEYYEKALKMRQALFPGNHPDVAVSLRNIGIPYWKLGDKDKILEYYKQVYGIYSALFNEGYAKNREIKSYIESIQPKFFVKKDLSAHLQQAECIDGNKVGFECRWMIKSHGVTNDNLIELKQKIQKEVLNSIVEAVDKKGWSKIYVVLDWGVKGYMEKEYLKKKLGELGNKNENIELAQMLCFESMNLGIMKSEEKPYEVVKSFTRENPELVKKIAKEHPEFFVDGSIVEACVNAMPKDKLFQKHIFEHVKYMGMEERRKRGL